MLLAHLATLMNSTSFLKYMVKYAMDQCLHN